MACYELPKKREHWIRQVNHMKHSNPSLPIRATVLATSLAASLALVIAAWAYPSQPNTSASAQAQVNVAVSQEKAPEQEEPLVLRDTDGMVCVYRGDVLFYKTDIPVVSLPEQNRKELAEGIEVANETEMHQLLEDFGA